MTITTPEGHEFVLYKNETVTIDLFSSLFITDGELKGSYSYAGKAPLLPNKKAIYHADLLEKHTSGELESLQVRLGNIYWTNVNMIYQVIDQKEIEFTLTLNLSLINETLKKTLLSKITFPKYHLGNTPEEIENSMMQAAINVDYTQIPYAFGKVLNYGFGGNVIDEQSNIIRECEPIVNSIREEATVLKFNAPNRLVNDRLKYFVVPYFYLADILGRVTEFLGFQKGGDVFSDPDIRKMVLYNINSARISTYGLPWVNEADAKGMYISAKDHVPEISIAEFLKGLSRLGVYIVLKPSTGELLFKLKRNVRKFRKIDWSDKVLNLKKIENNSYGGFELKYENDDAYNRIEVAKDTVKVGLAEEEVVVSVSSLYNTPLFYLESPIMPVDFLSGNLMDENYSNLTNYTLEGGKKPIPLILLYQNGFNSLRENLSYKSEVTGNELILSGNRGIYSTYLKDYLLAVSGAKEIEVDLLLNNNDLSGWNDDDVIVLKSKTGVTSYCLFEQLSFDVAQESPLIRAKGKGIVLDSTVYKEFPKNVIFLKAEFTGFGWKVLGTTTFSYQGDVSIRLYENHSCTIPYSGNAVFDVDITVRSKMTDREFITDDLEKGMRAEVRNGVYQNTIEIFWTNSFDEFREKAWIVRTLVEVQPSPLFHIV